MGWRRYLIIIAGLLVTYRPLLAAEIRGDFREVVVLEGQIETGDYDKVKGFYGDMRRQFWLGSPSANQLYLASPGGNLTEAIKIGRLVRALKLNTIVPSRSDYLQAVAVKKYHLKNPKANYMCASACFFVFAAGLSRTSQLGNPVLSSMYGPDLWDDVILGIHRPYLTDIELRALTGDQAISSTNQIRALVENYLKEMNVPPKYSDLMFSIPKDQVRWITAADFHADLEGVMPELKDWLAARCDKRTDVEKVVWEKMKGKPAGTGGAIADMLSKKMDE
jgi:hypothetical protein